MKLIMENWRNYKKELLVETMTRNLITEWTKVIMVLIKYGMEEAENDTPLRKAYGINYDLWIQNVGKDFPTKEECNWWCNKGIPDKYTGRTIKRRSKLKSKTPKGIVPLEAFKLTIDFGSWKAEPDEIHVAVEAGFSSKENIYKNSRYPDMEPRRPKNNFLYVDIEVNTNYIKTKQDLLRQMNYINEKLRETLAHEFQHARDTRLRGQLITVKHDADYYFSPREIRGHARGYYERARVSRTTFEEVVDERIEMIRERSHRQMIFLLRKASEAQTAEERQEYWLRSESKKDLIKRLPEWKKALFEYARRQLPCAKLNNGDTIGNCGGSKKKNWFDKLKAWTLDKQRWLGSENASKEMYNFLKDPKNRQKMLDDLPDLPNKEDIRNWFMDDNNVKPGLSPFVDAIRDKLK